MSELVTMVPEFKGVQSPEDAAEQAIARGADARHLLNVLPVIRQEITALQKALENRMHMAVQKGELTPDKAQAGWMEADAYRNLLSRMEQKIRAAGLTVT